MESATIAPREMLTVGKIEQLSAEGRLTIDQEILDHAICVSNGATQEEERKSPVRKRLIDTTSAERKTYPIGSGLLDYFPDALAAVANLSYEATQQHHPDKMMHHDRDKSSDHADCIIRHFIGRGGFDGKVRESAALAWRALALLQEELEAEYGLELPRAAFSAKAGKPAP